MEWRLPRAIGSLVLFALAMAAIAGCGGGSRSSSSSAGATTVGTTSTGTTSTPGDGTTARFISEADAICARATTEIDATQPKSTSKLETERVVPDTAILEGKAIVALEGLRPPPALASDWAQMLKDRRSLAKGLVSLLRATNANDKAAIEQLARSKERIRQSLRAVAERAGFKDCGEVGLATPSSGAGGGAKA